MNRINPHTRATKAAALTRTPPRAFPNLWTMPRAVQIDWSYPAFSKRDLRLDFLRGFAVVVMVVNHFGGSSWLYLITGGNNFFTSGAEAFIFISGFVVGMVYGGIALQKGIRAAQVKALQRAWTLYKVTLVLTILFAALSAFFGMEWARELKVDDPLVFVLNVATLRQTMYLTDIPLIYTFLMFASAGALWLLFKRHTFVLIALSGALWLIFQIAPQQTQLPWPIEGNTTFNLAAWQLLFFLAMVLGYHRDIVADKLRQIPRAPYLILSGLLLFWLLQVHDSQGAFLSSLIPGMDVQPFMSEFFLKSALAPGRLIASLIVFQFAYLAATQLWKPLWAAFGWFLLPLGQNALYAYIMHVVLIGGFYAILPYFPINVTTIGTLNTSLQLLTLLAIWAMVQRRFLFRWIPR